MRHLLFKLTLLILICILLLEIPAFAVGYFYDGSYHEYTAEPIRLVVNGDVIEGDMPPILLNDRTMVPAVFVFTALGADVTWLSRTRQVEIKYGSDVILLTIDSREVKFNNRTVYINDADPPAKIINDRTMIPVRFVAEQLGMDVDWINETRTVTVDSPVIHITPAPTEQPTATPTATPAPTATPIPLQGKITSVKYQNHEITVKGSGLDQLSISKLSNPLRYIFDFEDANFTSGDKNTQYNDGYVAAIRYANHPTYGRLVIDAEEGTTYTYTSTPTTMTIKLSRTSVNPTATPAATNPPSATSKPTTEPTAKPTTVPSTGKHNENPIVVLDAGHGGSDPGALGRDEEGNIVAKEKDVNLDITLKVYELLKADGIDTYLTRKDDSYVSLTDRTNYTNSLNADIFVSIHSNAVENTTTNGMMVMYNPNSGPTSNYFTYSTEMAEFVLEQLKSGTDLKSLGLRDGSGLWVIRKTAMPAILVECAFITNESDREKLTSDEYQDKIAKSIYLGILDTLEKAK